MMDDDIFLVDEFYVDDKLTENELDKGNETDEKSVSTAQSYSIEMIGNVLLSLQNKVRKQIIHWAVGLVIQMTSEILATSRKLPVYRSEPLDDESYLDIDLEGTIDQYITSRNKIDAIRVFKRAKTGHSVLLIIDSSFSMSGQKIVMAAAAAATICHLFDSRDIGVVKFGTKSEIIKQFDNEVSTESLVEQIFGIIPRGLTNIYLGLKVGLEALGARNQGKYTAILLSDCDINTGKVPSIIAWKLRGLKIITIPPTVNDFVADLIARDAQGDLFTAEKVMDIPTILKKIFERV